MPPKNPDDTYKLVASDFQKQPDAEVYSCRFGERAGWALLMLHEPSGAVAILSDYGSWTNLWPPHAHGRASLKAFLAECDYAYLAGKFTGSQQTDEFDFEATVKELKLTVLRHRRSDGLGREAARTFFDELDEMGFLVENQDDPAAFGAELSREFHDHFTEVWELYEYRKKPEYLWLVRGILPALVAEIRKTLPAKTEE